MEVITPEEYKYITDCAYLLECKYVVNICKQCALKHNNETVTFNVQIFSLPFSFAISYVSICPSIKYSLDVPKVFTTVENTS